MDDLFANNDAYRPLADRMRPQSCTEFIGQEHLFGEQSALRKAIDSGKPHSMILWGPPGTGKTMLAHSIAADSGMKLICTSPSSLLSKWVGDGEKVLRNLFIQAQSDDYGCGCVLLFDEVNQ